jgi:hypothetical protein
MKPNLAILLCTLTLLSACDALQADRTALLATSATPAERPSCNACHGYAPRTGAHRFHLDTINQPRHAESCHDCHAASIAMSGPVFDSLFTDSIGNTFHSKGWPWQALDTSKLTYQPDFSEMIDSAPLVARWREPGAEFPEWITRSSSRAEIPGHANGKVDVVFAKTPSISVWDPASQTCSSVKCHEPDLHPSGFVYRWKEPTP